MSISLPDNISPGTRVTVDKVRALAAKCKLSVPDDHVQDWATLLTGCNHYAKEILSLPDYYPKVNYEVYPRTDVHRPDGKAREKGGWAWKATVKSTKPKNGKLKNVTVALKDNIALAGVPCTNGTAALKWVPDVDATLVTRILDAGGIVVGKAACESSCIGAVSDTSVTGPVHNPYAEGYSCGGSSSGCGRLVGSGLVDVAIGVDQGGSIRIPSANCGLVGLKPTWGLVPFTGVISLEATVDHAGPMAKNVPDCARLLEVIAGTDSIDDRQPFHHPQGTVKYAGEIAKHLAIQQQPLKCVKIGVLKESFLDPLTDPNVAKASRSAIEGLRTLGAELKTVSIPPHKDYGMLWMVILSMSGSDEGLLAGPHGRKQLLFPERAEKTGPRLSQQAFDALGPGAQNIYLRGMFLKDEYGAKLHTRCTNLARKLTDAYDAAFRDVDVLVMPTVIFPPTKLRVPGTTLTPLETLSRTTGLTYNTSNFNVSGHPALSFPVGFVPARDDEKIKLPTGLQVVGRKFEDLMCLKVAASWEKAYNWKAL